MPSVAENQKPAPGELYLDHIAHFVPDLGAAARVAELLGFKVTPESAHRAQGAPAGTSNRTIMLEEGYIEILAPTLETPHAQRVRERMARYDGGDRPWFVQRPAAARHEPPATRGGATRVRARRRSNTAPRGGGADAWGGYRGCISRAAPRRRPKHARCT